MKRRYVQSGFTMLELILVMLIIAIMAGMIAPSLGRFTAGRAVDNFSRQIVGVAQYARALSISEARVYRLNFDQNAGQFWLTADTGGGNFTSPKGDFNRRFPAPDGVRMQVQVGVQPNISLMLSQNVQQQAVPQSGVLIDGTQTGAAGQLMQNIHTQGQTYVEFSPTGRIDPVSILISDNSGHSATVACATPTDRFQVQEASR
jgi:prepilin-type N-terminal cleavage/methylation domain-containing protein